MPRHDAPLAGLQEHSRLRASPPTELTSSAASQRYIFGSGPPPSVTGPAKVPKPRTSSGPERERATFDSQTVALAKRRN